MNFFHISVYSNVLGCCALEGLFDAEGCVHCFHHDVTSVLYHIRGEEVSFLLRSDEDQLPVYNSLVGCTRSHPQSDHAKCKEDFEYTVTKPEFPRVPMSHDKIINVLVGVTDCFLQNPLDSLNAPANQLFESVEDVPPSFHCDFSSLQYFNGGGLLHISRAEAL